jgi:Kef-type K+ transport system membrane component KefB
VRRGNVGVAIAALVGFAAYAIYVVVISIAGEGHGSFFWASIVLIVLLAAAALWGAKLLFSRRSVS